MSEGQPWGPANSTDRIRRIARDPMFAIVWTAHAKDQMARRDLIAGDVIYVLKHGFVYANPTSSTRPGFYKYLVENRSPNSGARVIRVVAIPDEAGLSIKVVTVMWVDET